MHAGIVHLDSLIRYVTLHDPVGRALEPRSPAGNEYDKLAEAVAGSIPRERGFYLWGTYALSGLWSNVYVGKARLGKKTDLYVRILKELKTERIFLWEPFFTAVEIETFGARYHPRKWHDDYKNDWKRALCKAGASKIVWVAVPELDNAVLPSVEANLIKSLNPRANMRRPKPTAAFQSVTNEVIRHLLEEIDKHRPQTVPIQPMSTYLQARGSEEAL